MRRWSSNSWYARGNTSQNIKPLIKAPSIVDKGSQKRHLIDINRDFLPEIPLLLLNQGSKEVHVWVYLDRVIYFLNIAIQ